VHRMRVVLKNLMRRNPTIFNPLWAFLYPLIYRRDGKYFGSDSLDGLQAFQTIFEEIAGDHPGYAAVAGAPSRIASGWRLPTFMLPHRYRWCQILSRQGLLDISGSGLANRLPRP
jgi:hypothetical protein